MPLESIERNVDTDVAATQWQARVDLAAAHRTGGDARLPRGHLQPPDPARARPQ